jgi:hypothetical protein
VDAYDFVTLHAPKVTYGIDANEWTGNIFDDLASKAEVLEHYARSLEAALADASVLTLLGHRATPRTVAGRGCCVLCWPVAPDASPVLLETSGIIDATALCFAWNCPTSLGLAAASPAQSAPTVVDAAGLRHLTFQARRFVVVGGGKSGCDCVLHLRRELLAAAAAPTVDDLSDDLSDDLASTGMVSDDLSDELSDERSDVPGSVAPLITWVVATPLAFFRRVVYCDVGSVLRALLAEHDAAPDAPLSALPSYSDLFHHVTDAPPVTSHGATLGDDERTLLRESARRIEGQRVDRVCDGRVLLSGGDAIDAGEDVVVVTCTGARLDDAARARADAMYDHMAHRHRHRPSAAEAATDADADLHSRTFIPLPIHYFVTVSNALLASAYFVCDDPREALRVLQSSLHFFRTPPFAHFFHSLRCWAANRDAYEAAFGPPVALGFFDPSGFLARDYMRP